MQLFFRLLKTKVQRNRKKMALGGQIYNTFFKSSSRYFLTLMVGAFFFERTVDGLSDKVFDSINKGRQWKDIKHLAIKKDEEEDAE